LSTSAPRGQNLAHLPQFMHLDLSMVGASKPVCFKAPTGHTLTDGQGWFLGQRETITLRVLPLLPTLFSSATTLFQKAISHQLRFKSGLNIPDDSRMFSDTVTVNSSIDRYATFFTGRKFFCPGY
jgi:hypothetical protein